RVDVNSLPRHLLPDTATVDGGGRLSIAGVDLLDLAEEVGTPAFVYDEAHLRARCREAVGAFGPGNVAYASKAFLCRAMAARAVERIRHVPHAAELVGIHAHIGSQIFLVRSFEKAVETLADFIRPLDVDELCLGGGLGVAYMAGEEAPTITEWAETLHDACRASGITPRVTAEPGRAIAAAAAVTLYRVGTVKDIPGVRTYVSVDGGMSGNPRPVLYGGG